MTVMYVDEYIDRNIVARYCVIPSGWPEGMNYSGVIIKTLYHACFVGRISGPEDTEEVDIERHFRLRCVSGIMC